MLCKPCVSILLCVRECELVHMTYQYIFMFEFELMHAEHAYKHILQISWAETWFGWPKQFHYGRSNLVNVTYCILAFACMLIFAMLVVRKQRKADLQRRGCEFVFVSLCTLSHSYFCMSKRGYVCAGCARPSCEMGSMNMFLSLNDCCSREWQWYGNPSPFLSSSWRLISPIT